MNAFDFSSAAREKALKKAKRKNIEMHYDLMNIEDFKTSKRYDAIALVYVHVESTLRKKFHHEIAKSLASAGYLILKVLQKNKCICHPVVRKTKPCSTCTHDLQRFSKPAHLIVWTKRSGIE